MKRRIPLSAKLVAWSLLNLLLLVGLAAILITSRVGIDVLVMRFAAERILSVTGLVIQGLNARPIADWDALLQKYSQAHGVNFRWFRVDGTRIAGEATAIPKEVQELLANIGETVRVALGEGSASTSSRITSYQGPPFRGFPHRPRFLVRTSSPTRYWLAVPAVSRSDSDGAVDRGLLLMESPSLHGGGLFIDVRPLVILVGATVGISILFWLPMLRSLTRSIRQTTEATELIANGHFDTRVADTRRDELGQLGAAVNKLSERLNGFVTGQKRFLGGIAHELCSPLARAQVALSLLERETKGGAQKHVEDLREEVEQMAALVNELLSFSKASLGAQTVQLKPVRVADVVDRAIQRENQPGINVHVDVSPDIWVRADADLLQRALGNLLRNSIRYAGAAGPIRLSAQRKGNAASIVVSDCGPGVPEESLQHLFDPFYRVDDTRARESGGVGFGLTIVKTCIDACRGSVNCRNKIPSGYETTIRLDLEAEPA